LLGGGRRLSSHAQLRHALRELLLELGAEAAQRGRTDPQHLLEECRLGHSAEVIARIEAAAEAGRDREAVERDPAELAAGDGAAQAAQAAAVVRREPARWRSGRRMRQPGGLRDIAKRAAQDRRA
jgi:hypothetical protein